MGELKLFVWEDCFRDWSAGLGIVLACDSEEARDLLEEKIGYRHSDLSKRPDVYELNQVKAFFVHGGC